MKNIVLSGRFGRFVASLSLFSLLLAPPAAWSQKLTAQLEPVAAEAVPLIGTFYSLTLNQPPLPYLPFREMGLPVYALPDGSFVFDDRSLTLAEASFSPEMTSMSDPPLPGGGSGGGGGEGGETNPPPYSVPGLKLTIPVVNGGSVQTTLMEANTNSAYDVFQALVVPATVPWSRVAGGGIGQTSFTFSVSAYASNSFFRAANVFDTDGDALPDAFEQLVTLTDSTKFDSDGDGISDADEISSSGRPNHVEYGSRVAITAHASRPQALEGVLSGQFTILLPQPAPPGGVTVFYHLGGSAIPTNEYSVNPSGNSLLFPAGTLSSTINVNALEDNIGDELDRTVELRVTNATVFAVDGRAAQVELVNNDAPTVRIIATDLEAAETRPSTTNNAEFLFVRDAGFNQAMNIFFSLSGSASAGDYTGLANPVTIAAGQRSVTITLRPVQDTAVEGLETLTVTLTANAAYTIDPSNYTATVSLADDDLPVVEILASDSDAREAGLDPGQFRVSRTGSTGQPLTVRYTAYGTASSSNFTSGTINVVQDYAPLPGTVTIPAGAPFVNIPVTPLNDTQIETTETVIAVLRGQTNYLIGPGNTATVFLDDSNPQTYDAEITRRGAAYQPGVSDVPVEIVVTRFGTSRAAAEVGYWVTNSYTGPWNNWYRASGNVNALQCKILFAPNAPQALLQIAPGPSAWPPGCGVIITNNPNPGAPTILNSSSLWFYDASRLLNLNVIQRVAIEGGQQAVVRVTRPVSSPTAFNFRVRFTGVAVPDNGGALTQTFPMPANVLSQDILFTAAVDSPEEGWEPLYVEVDPTQTTAVPDVRSASASLAQLFFRDSSTLPAQPPVDTDQDGLTDSYEMANSLDPYRFTDHNADSDRDGLNQLEEQSVGANPNNADSDNDGVRDLVEYLSDPASAINPATAAESLDNSVPVRVRVSSCYKCHSAALQIGERVFQSQPPSRPLADEILRLAKGKSYPVRAYAEAANSPANLYTAQIVPEATPAGFFLEDPQGVLATNKLVPTNLSARIAWLHIPRIELGVDANRDNSIRFLPDATDQTTADRPYAFWLNNDADTGNDDSAQDLEPFEWNADSVGDIISNQRDLEDFTRLHLKLDAVSASQLQQGTLSLTLEWRSKVGNPEIRIFRAYETNGAMGYLTNLTVASQQISGSFGTALGTIFSTFTFPASYWSGATGSNLFRPLLFEARVSGSGQIVAVLNQGGQAVAESPPVHLRLRPVTDMFEHYTVGDSISMLWNQVPASFTPVPDTTLYTDASPELKDQYILFVHGWRMRPWERRGFAHTAFKRLYWQGYRGRYGFFSWPTDWVQPPGGFIAEPENYNRSERIAWLSSFGFERLIQHLNREYPRNVRVFAHSMGNVVVSEMLRRHTAGGGAAVIHTYVATQAATPAHAYDPVNPALNRYSTDFQTPESYANYRPTGKHYFSGIRDGADRILNYHNLSDAALNLWDLNQDTKPNAPYVAPDGRFYYAVPGLALPLDLRGDIYQIYAHAAEARSRALGAAVTPGFNVLTEIDGAVDLNVAPYQYLGGFHEHSAQFLSTLMRRSSYYTNLLSDFRMR